MRIRTDREELQADGGRVRYADWMGGPTIAGVANCKIDGLQARYTVRVTGEPDTWFSIPAETTIRRKRITGYLTGYDVNGNLHFVVHTRHRETLIGFGLYTTPAQ